MPRISWLADAARATGHPVTEVEGWETRGSATFNPRGLVWHHTAGAASGDMPSLNILVNGKATLKGPLSQYGLGRSGRIYVIAAGRANHAGAGSWGMLTGNASVVGIEAEHVGRVDVPWPAVQLDAYRKLSAQILLHLGATVNVMCGHKEWAPTRKVDPIGLNMDTERAAVAALMNQGDDELASKGQIMWVDFAFNAFPDEFSGDANYWYNLDENDPQWNTGFRPALGRVAQQLFKDLAGHPHDPPTNGTPPDLTDYAKKVHSHGVIGKTT